MIIQEPAQYRLSVPLRRVAEPSLPIRFAFGRAVRRLRTAAGQSEEQCGARAGLHPIHVVALERGEYPVTLVVLERLAIALEMPVSVLLREAEREQERVR